MNICEQLNKVSDFCYFRNAWNCIAILFSVENEIFVFTLWPLVSTCIITMFSPTYLLRFLNSKTSFRWICLIWKRFFALLFARKKIYFFLKTKRLINFSLFMFLPFHVRWIGSLCPNLYIIDQNGFCLRFFAAIL